MVKGEDISLSFFKGSGNILAYNSRKGKGESTENLHDRKKMERVDLEAEESENI